MYGKLYNWYAVNDPRGLAPTGWHIPSDAEWTTLPAFLGGNTIAGGAMKATTGWNAPNTGATNSSGFTGLPGGYRDENGEFSVIGYDGYWWTSTEDLSDPPSIAFSHLLLYDRTNANEFGLYKTYGISVRCVRD